MQLVRELLYRVLLLKLSGSIVFVVNQTCTETALCRSIMTRVAVLTEKIVKECTPKISFFVTTSFSLTLTSLGFFDIK